MRKRLRKKLRRGEFKELGFELRFNLPPELDEEQLLAFWDRFIGDAIEANALFCGGGCGRGWDVMVFRGGRTSATETDRELLEKWLEKEPLVSNIEVGPLV
ncbi:MAG: YggL family protein [Acidobacteria bacterium]|nr:YggL family protein [Acidobacteriota bacterium]